MFMVDLRRRLQDERCGEGEDIRIHFDTMRMMREDLAAMGGSISDGDFTAMVLGSLPASYDAYLSAITATVSVTNTALDPEALMVSIIDEYDRRTVKSNKNKKDDKNAAFYAGNSSKGSRKAHGGSKKNIECFNCKKRGHVKADCWAKGGGKEGQGPKGKGKKKSAGDEANAAEDEDGVWMAAVEGLGRIGPVDNEGEQGESVAHYRKCDGKLLFSDEELDDSPTSLINFLGPIDPTDYFESPDDWELSGDEYTTPIEIADISEDIPALMDVSDSSDDECGEISQADINSNNQDKEDDIYGDLPNLEEVSDSSDEDCHKEDIDNGTSKGCTFSGDEDKVLARDTLGEAYTTTYGCATLVNVAGINNSVETELYDSGASRHMSPYRSRFENYKQIEGKSITAADKRIFQAVGVGNLRVKIPNGENTTTILLKDVLHAPDLGLTLVSISCAAAAGYSLLFRGPFYRIFDPKQKLVGEIKA